MFAYETEIRWHLFAAAAAMLTSLIDLNFTKEERETEKEQLVLTSAKISWSRVWNTVRCTLSDTLSYKSSYPPDLSKSIFAVFITVEIWLWQTRSIFLKGHSPGIEFCQTLPISCLFSQAFDNVMETTRTVVEGGAFNSQFSHDVTKIQTKKLSILLSFWVSWGITAPKRLYLNKFWFERVLRFAIEDVWISRLLRDAAFSWRPGRLLCGLKTLPILGDFAI